MRVTETIRETFKRGKHNMFMSVLQLSKNKIKSNPGVVLINS